MTRSSWAQSTSKASAKHPGTTAAPKPTVQLNVRDLGATGDGKTKDEGAVPLTETVRMPEPAQPPAQPYILH